MWAGDKQNISVQKNSSIIVDKNDIVKVCNGIINPGGRIKFQLKIL
jgi:hypothetical protein